MIHTAKAWKGSTEKRSRSGNVQACYRFTTPLKLDEADYRPPAPMLFVSHALSAGTLQFIRLPAGWAGENICPPQHQFLFCLQGQLEVRTSDGKKRVFRPGAFKLFSVHGFPDNECGSETGQRVLFLSTSLRHTLDSPRATGSMPAMIFFVG